MSDRTSPRTSLRRYAASLATALLLRTLSAVPALAATPPPNDTPAGAVVVTTPLPFHTTQDTTGATTDAVDAALNAQCGAPATNASVWFTYTDTTGAGFVVDTSASSYGSGVMIVEGDPASGTVVACGPGGSGVRGAAGTTYAIMAFSDNATQGGTLDLTVYAAPPAPTTAATIDAKGYALKDGSLKVSGTYSCTNAGYLSFINGEVTQTVGRTKITGSFWYEPLDCDGAVHRWEAVVTSTNGLFAGGKAASVSMAVVCGLLECAQTFTAGKIQVSRSGK